MGKLIQTCVGFVRRDLVVALAVVAFVAVGSSAWATGPSGCAAVTAATAAAPPAVADVMNCVFDSIAPYALITAILVVVVPLLIVVWGMRGGFGLVSSLFRKAVSAVRRA
jgi:hypothetical protein